MRILVYGAGVIGSIFAGRLAAAGEDVTVLARGTRLEQVREQGIILRNALTGSEEQIPVKTVDVLRPEDVYDYVLVVLQRTQVDEILPVLRNNSSSTFVFVVNTAGGYQSWIDAVGADRLMIGFPSAGGQRIEHRVDYFVGKGLIRLFQTTTFGEPDGSRTPRLRRLIGAFSRSGIPAVACRDMNAWQKTHVAMVTAIANALYKYESDNYRLATSYPDVLLMLQAVQEGFAVLKKLGVSPTPRKLWYLRLPPKLLAQVFRLTLGTQLAAVAIARHTRVARSEMIALQSEFDTLIEASGLETPAIDELRAHLV